MTNMTNSVDFNEVASRALKYLLEGLVVGVAAVLIPSRNKQLKIEEAVMLGLTAAAVFAVLDMFAPSVGGSAKTGAGFGIGAGLVQWPGALGALKGV
jgi:ABC-type Co2+ transport system permease subunit